MRTRRQQQKLNAQRRYEKTEKGKAARARQNSKRVAVMGERYTFPLEAKELVIRLRNERKATSGR